MLEISPQRAASDVRSSEVIRVRFDRAMDHASVASRFHVEPGVQGALTWPSDQELAFEHVPFNPSSQYVVVLDPGYRDARGNVNSLRHSWSFRTEAAPTLAGSAPGPGDRGVDPASYLTLTFSRAMDQGTLIGAISLSPNVPFAIHPDASDPRRVVLAPQTLLEPRTSYTVNVERDARDVDGNRLASGAIVSFATGDFRPLRHWISFVGETSTGAGGGGLWIVDDNHLPRRLVGEAISSFSWSGDGGRLLLRSQSGTWSDQPLDGTPTTLPITGTWADFLAPGRGYAYLDGGTLRTFVPGAQPVTVATGVSEAAVAAGGRRLAFVTHDASSSSERATEIDGYDTELRTRYRLQTEPDAVDGLAWSPDGQSLAYRLEGADTAHRQIRVRSLRDGGTVTVATGDMSVPAWQADRQHVVFSASVTTPAGQVRKAFRFAVTDGLPHALTVAAGIPGAPEVEVTDLRPSPDGHSLAFLSDAGGRPGVFTMNADGTGLTQLTDSDPDRFPYSARAVAWTPG